MPSTPKARIKDFGAHLKKAESDHSSYMFAYRSFLQEYSKRRSRMPRTMEDLRTNEMNIAFGEVETFVGRVTGYVPDVTIGARKQESLLPAIIAEAAVGYWFEALNVPAEWIKAVRTCGIGGIGWLKVGWNRNSPRKGVVKVSREEFNSMKTVQEDIRKVLGGAPTDEQIYQYLQKTLNQVSIGEPTCLSVSPENMLFDPYCTSLSQVGPRWLMHRYWRSVRGLKADKNLSTARNKIEGTSFGTTQELRLWGDAYDNNEADPMERVMYNELYDIENQQLICFTGMDIEEGPLLFDDEIPFKTGHPFVPVLGWEVDGSPYPMGVIELIMEQVRGINEQRRITAAIRRGQIPKNFVTEKLLGSGKDVKEVLMSDMPNDTAVIKNLNGESIASHVFRLEGGQINPDQYQADAVLKNDAEWVLGFNEVSRGSLANGTHRSAAEITSAMKAGGDRVGFIVESARQTMVHVARKMVGHATQYMTAQDVMRIRGFAATLADAQQRYLQQMANDPTAVPSATPSEVLSKLTDNGAFFTPEGDMMMPVDANSLGGEFDFSIDVGPKMLNDGPTRAQNALQMLQVLGAYPEVNRAELIKFALSQGWDVKDVSRFIAPPQPPMPDQAQQGQSDMGGIGSVAGSNVAPPGASVAPGLTQQ